jgi:ornithine cyclodeaminase
LATVRPLREVYVYDANLAQAEKFAAQLAVRAPELRCRIVANSKELVEASQIVICATTSTKPVLPDVPSLFVGKHIIGIGSYQPHVREFSDAALTATLQSSGGVYIDTSHALIETGDLIIPLAQGSLQESQIRLFSQLVVSGGNPELYKQTTLFKSVGSALFDLCAAQMVYQQVVAAGAGLQVEM